jgi:uncharacterized membrane protein YuzA (DUF378 family)
MIAIISLLVVLVLSLMIVRVASVALTLTGLSRELARFQARSAFTGSGFTTNESEKVVQHPVRRRIILLLMLLGNAGIITAVSTLMLSFMDIDQADGITGSLWFRVTLLIIGLCALWTLANSRWVDQHLQRAITWALKRWTKLEVRDYAGLLHLTREYVVVELSVGQEDWLANRELARLRLAEEGVLVLGIERSDSTYLGAPRGTTTIKPGDTLILYGKMETLKDLDERMAGPGGNWAHVAATEKRRAESVEEEAADSKSKSAESKVDDDNQTGFTSTDT